jgi:hypothetical protein
MTIFHKMLVYALMTTFVVCGAHAQHNSGTGILCDTRDQIIELVQAGWRSRRRPGRERSRAECVRPRDGAFHQRNEVGETTLKGEPVAIMELVVIGAAK